MFRSVTRPCWTLWPHGLQHARLRCPWSTPTAYSCPSSRWSSNHLILCHPLLLLFSICPSVGIFLNDSIVRIKWPKYWSFSFIISPTNEYSGLISFGIDQLELLAVQGTLKSLLQHSSSKASILWCSDFFIVQLAHQHMTTGKTIALTGGTLLA